MNCALAIFLNDEWERGDDVLNVESFTYKPKYFKRQNIKCD